MKIGTEHPSPSSSEPTLPREVVTSIAALAQLELSDEETTRYQQQLSHVLNYFRQVAEVDTTDRHTSERPTLTPDQLRADIAAAPLPPGKVLANAPDQDAGQFRVPAILLDDES